MIVEIEKRPEAPAGDVTWEVSVRVAADAADTPDQGAVHFRLSHAIGPDESEAEPPPVQLLRTRLKVEVVPTRDSSPLDDVELSIKTHSSTVDEIAPIKAYLFVKNKSSHAIRFEGAEISAPSFVEFRPSEMAGPVAPHETLIVPLNVRVRETARAGEWLILARVTFSRGEGAFKQTGIGVVEQKVSVGSPDAANVLKVEPSRESSPLDDVQISLKADFATISEFAPVKAYLLVKNTSTRPVRFEGVEIRSPSFLEVSPTEKTGIVAPHKRTPRRTALVR